MTSVSLLALVLALPVVRATAQDARTDTRIGQTGTVSQFMAAQDLFAIGRAQNDPLAVLAAARLAARIAPTEADRTPDPAAESLPPSHPDAKTMFTAAKALAGEDAALTDMVSQIAAEAPRLPARTMLRSTHGIAAQASHSFDLAFFGGSLAEIGLLGDGRANLDLAATMNETPLCLDKNPADRALCVFSLTENSNVTVTITNQGNTAASYSLLTN